MKSNCSLKKYIFMFMAFLMPTQQTHSFELNNLPKNLPAFGAAAIIGTLAYAAYLQINQSAPAQIPDAQTIHIQSIIFDLDGVLCATNKLRAFHEIGIPVTLGFITNQMVLPSEKILFDTLAGVPAISNYTSYNKGLQMPQIMIDWQVGAQDLDSIQKS